MAVGSAVAGIETSVGLIDAVFWLLAVGWLTALAAVGTEDELVVFALLPQAANSNTPTTDPIIKRPTRTRDSLCISRSMCVHKSC